MFLVVPEVSKSRLGICGTSSQFWFWRQASLTLAAICLWFPEARTLLFDKCYPKEGKKVYLLGTIFSGRLVHIWCPRVYFCLNNVCVFIVMKEHVNQFNSAAHCWFSNSWVEMAQRSKTCQDLDTHTILISLNTGLVEIKSKKQNNLYFNDAASTIPPCGCKSFWI